MTNGTTAAPNGERDADNAAVITEVLGNVGDPDWAARLDGAELDLLELDQWAAQRTRLRRTTAAGRDLAVSLARNQRLRDGDVLRWDERERTAVLARIKLGQMMVIDISPLLGSEPDVLARGCFELGHAIGNQHWPAVVRGTTIYVPVTVAEKVMASVMKTHGFEGVTYRFVDGVEVLPYLAPHEARRLFGGADQGIHSHALAPEPHHDVAATG